MSSPSLKLNEVLVGVPEWVMQAMEETHLSLTEVINLRFEGLLAPWFRHPVPLSIRLPLRRSPGWQ
ncbi:MAG: hypothetical protein ACYDD0_05735 [Candidatus Dormibacteria bacterium]